MSTNHIAIVGRLAKNATLLDGQTVKTQILYEELCLHYPDRDIICVDTYQYKKNAIKILKDTFYAFIHCKHIFVLLSRNGRKYFYPLLTGLNKIFRRRLYHDVIGGDIAETAAISPALCRQLRCFEVNWVEFEQMKQDLNALHINNAEVLPNFKHLVLLKPEDLQDYQSEPFVFTMFSRVTKEKGMTDAINALDQVNNHFGDIRAFLHIYGPIEDSYKDEFNQLLTSHSDTVFYKGCIPQGKSVEALKDSFLLLFPTYYFGEGMPGTIIDAFSAGLPVIATDWHYNADIIKNGVTGFCYDWRKKELLSQYMIYSIEHPECINQMRPACLKEAEKYTPASAMKQICSRIEGKMRGNIHD